MIYVGTDLKIKIDIECEGFDMNRDDFSVDVKRSNMGGKIWHVDKKDMVHDDDGWYILLPTRLLGVGLFYAVVVAQVPDDDWESGLRQEVQVLPLFNIEGI